MASCIVPSPLAGPLRAAALALLSLALAASAALAAESPRLLDSARGLGLGGAYTAVASGTDAMLYNPAGLVMATEWRLELNGAQETTDDGATDDYFGDLKELPEVPPDQAQAYLDRNEHDGHLQRTQGIAAWHTGGGFGAAYFENVRQQAEPVPGPDTELTYDRVYGSIFTWAWQSDTRLAMWGFSLKGMGREVSRRLVNGNDVSQPDFEIADQLSTGNDYAYDLGAIIRLPIPWLRPQFGVALLNGGSPDFGLERTEGIPQEHSASLAFYPHFSDAVQVLLAYEHREVAEDAFESGDPVYREHYGGEFSFFPTESGFWGLQLRGGKYQNREAYGATINLSHFLSLEAAGYGVQTGDEPGARTQDRIWIQARLGL